jgi:hypothetical protein
MTYRVNYRPGENDPWQLYAETRDLAKANKIADEVKESGYQAQVVDDLTPSAQPFPDAAETSASAYYPGSNWSADYNYYVVPGGRYNNYGWYGGWNPWYGFRLYPNYWWNGGRSWYSAGWPGHYWGHGWHRGAGWGAGWSGSHRYWNYSHPDRGTHSTYNDRHGEHAHHMYHAHHMAAGHHSPGHHAAARHSSHSSYAHRGIGHRGAGRRTAGHRGAAHHAAGHAARGGRGHGAGGHHSPGRHAAGHHGRHHDP